MTLMDGADCAVAVILCYFNAFGSVGGQLHQSDLRYIHTVSDNNIAQKFTISKKTVEKVSG